MGPRLNVAEADAPRESIAVAIRPADASELQLVRGTWSRCFVQRDRQRSAGPKPRETLGIDRAVDIGRRMDGVMVDASLLIRAHHRLVDELLASPDTRVAVACLPDVPDSPVGWACWQVDSKGDGHTLHFVYVQPVARRSSIGRQLVLHSRCTVASHSTQDGLQLMQYLRRGTR